MDRDDLIRWFEDVDFSGYSTEALQAAYTALVDDTFEPPAPQPDPDEPAEDL